MKTKESGVYVLSTPGGLYVGSSIDLARRKRGHFDLLKKSRHPNRFLQNAFKKHATEFRFEILVLCSPEIVISQEQYFIDLLLPRYNIRRKAENQTGVKWSDESRARQSEISLQKWRDPETRRKFVDENRRRWKDPAFKARMREALTSKGMIAVKKYWEDPVNRAARSSIVKAQWTDPEIRSKRNAQWNDPEAKERHRIANSARWENDDQRQRQRDRLKAQWADPVQRAKMMEGRLAKRN